MPSYTPKTAAALQRTVNIKGAHLLALWKIAVVWPLLQKFMKDEGYEVNTLDSGDLTHKLEVNVVGLPEAVAAASRILNELGVPIAAGLLAGDDPHHLDQIGESVSTRPHTPGQPSSLDSELDPPGGYSGFRRYHPV